MGVCCPNAEDWLPAPNGDGDAVLPKPVVALPPNALVEGAPPNVFEALDCPNPNPVVAGFAPNADPPPPNALVGAED